MRASNLFLCFILLFAVLVVRPMPVTAAPAAPLNVQKYLDGQPGTLKKYRDGRYTAAQAIEAYSSYYSLNPRIVLTLLELGPKLLTNPKPAAELLTKPLGPSGPDGFTQQVEWAVRDIRSGFGPYTTPPVVRFTDGGSATLDLKQDASLLAVARFLAQGRPEAEWRTLIDGYAPLYTKLWGQEPATPTATPTPSAAQPFLKLPWPAGIEVTHSSYFDHVYPTVDRGSDDNSFIVNYMGRGNLSYNTHDGHDYYFPAQPTGTPILAAAPGIAYAYSTPGNGVVIRHGGAYAGYETVYWHLDQFAVIFQNKIDNGAGVRVEAGTVLGISGKSGFTDGGAHLHFEVRHNGKQVDPYGWYGPGADPCAAWTAGCEASVWLWDESLSGTYDFTRPDSAAPQDREPPVGSLAISPDQHLGLLAHFDNTVVPTIGKGFPEINSARGTRPRYEEGVFGHGVQASSAVEVTYPISGNVELERGTIALWAKLPAEYPQNSTKRNYLFAASANPEEGSVYPDTIALRREQTNDGGAAWNFWTVDDSGTAHNLTFNDTLSRDSWHHFVVTWPHDPDRKALYIDGQLVAQSHDAKLPASVGERLQLGRFMANHGVSGATFDELAVFHRVLNEREIKRLADRQDIYSAESGQISTARVVTDRAVMLDANAIDQQGGIVSVQLRRDNEPWSEPLSYYDNYRWSINGDEGEHTFAIRYRDRADNETVVTTTLVLKAPLEGSASIRSYTDTAAVIGMTVKGAGADDNSADHKAWLEQNVELQLSTKPDFRDAVWETWAERRVWNWETGQQRVVYVRFRDVDGRVTPAQAVGPDVVLP